MRIITLAVVATVLLSVVACSDEDTKGQEIIDTCKAKCAITTASTACKTNQTKCDADCRRLSNIAESNYYPGCGLCIAKTFIYQVKTDPPCDTNPTDPTCCWGVSNKKPEDTECRASCFEPDGGGAY
jgi:hypothetical protein